MFSQISTRVGLVAGLLAVAGLSGCSARSSGYCHECSPGYSMTPSYGHSLPAHHGHHDTYPTPAPPTGTYYHQVPAYGVPHEPAPAPPAVEPLPDAVSGVGQPRKFRTPRFLQPVSNSVRSLVDRIRD